VVFRTAVDYPVALALIAVCVILCSADVWGAVSLWLVLTGMMVATGGPFLLADRADQSRDHSSGGSHDVRKARLPCVC